MILKFLLTVCREYLSCIILTPYHDLQHFIHLLKMPLLFILTVIYLYIQDIHSDIYDVLLYKKNDESDSLLYPPTIDFTSSKQWIQNYAT